LKECWLFMSTSVSSDIIFVCEELTKQVLWIY
jgi:hypothetical protein